MATSKYFTEDEMTCKCCDELPPDGVSQELLDGLDKMVDKFGKFSLNCLYRCESHNAETPGSAPKSFHTLGMAADCNCLGIADVDEFADYAESLGIFNGIGRYYTDGFVHLDVGDRVYKWTEDDV